MTVCEDCDHLHTQRPADKPWMWMCTKHKRAGGYGFVNRTFSDAVPYLYCKDVNQGFCPLFEPKREVKGE